VLGSIVILNSQKPSNLSLEDSVRKETAAVAAGTIITLNASANDPNNDPIYYKFYLKSNSTKNEWEQKREWDQQNEWEWETTQNDIGTDFVIVEATDHKFLNIIKIEKQEGPINIVDPSNEPPKITGFSQYPKNSSHANTVVTLNVKAYDPNNDTIQYRFKEINNRGVESVFRGWQNDSQAGFHKNNNEIGNYIIVAEIKDNKNENIDDSEAVPYHITDTL